MDIYSLLNIKADVIQDFPVLANRVVDHQIELVMNQQTRALRQIEERVDTDKGLKVPTQSINEVIRKVLRLSSTKDYSMNNWTLKELRIISYYLMKLRGHDDAYSYAISLLDKNWKNLYFNGLIFYLLNSWNSIEAKYRSLTCDLLVNKLEQYQESNKRYLIYKNHSNLFGENGPLRMAALINAKNITIEDAPSIIGFKASALNQSYYSDVIIRYVKDKDIHDLNVIESLLGLNTLDRTKKIILAHLVERENNYADGMRRSFLCKFINRLLGDVSMIATWAPFIGATKEEAQILQRAMRLVNNWFTQQIIETFFEHCVQDPRRKLFWLKYVDYIMGFKIVASGSIKSMLMRDHKIEPLLMNHFIETESYTSQTSALILFIKDKMLVEFSDLGALYVYSHTHSQVRLVSRNKGKINSISDLKITSMPKLIESDSWDYYTYREEGRMAHLVNWETRLQAWMEKMLLNRDVKYSPFFLSEQEEQVFKATPIPLANEVQSELLISEEIKNQNSTKNTISTTDKGTNQTKKVKNETYPSYFKEEPILYNIQNKIQSKILFDNIRIISDTQGFYLHNFDIKESILLRNDILPIDQNGNIRVKSISPDSKWLEIVYNYKFYNVRIGYIRQTKKGFLFKHDMAKTADRRLTFKL